MISVATERGEVLPALLNWSVRLKIRDQQVEELLDIGWKPEQPPGNLFPDTNIVSHGNKITTL